MKSYILTFFLLVVTIAASAQDFDLNSYKFRHQKYRGLSTNFNLSNIGNQSFLSLHDTFQNQDNFDNNVLLNSQFNIQPAYFSFVNTEELQQSRTIQLFENLNHTFNFKDDSQPNNTKRTIWGNNLFLNYAETQRRYTGIKFNYLSFNTSAHYNMSKSELHSQDYWHQHTGNLDIGVDASVQLGKGFGRLEYVSDAVLAQFIHIDLAKKQGTSLNANQVHEIAKGISYIKHRRYLDFRFRLIDQLSMMDSVLKNNGVEGNTITYFTALNDNWLYANTIARFSGERWTYHLDIAGNSQKLKATSVRTNDLIDYGQHELYVATNQFYDIGFGIDYERSTQKSQFIQHACGLFFKSALRFSTNGSYLYENIFYPPPDKILQNFTIADVWLNSLIGFWQHLYQPNTRTILTSTIQPGLMVASELYLIRTEKVNNDVNLELLPSVTYNFTFYHWISPQLNFNISADIGVMNSSSKVSSTYNLRTSSNNTINHLVQAGLGYQFF